MAPLPLEQPLTYDDVSYHIYGMSPKDWKKKYQLPATEDQLQRYEESKKYHATHAKNVLEDIVVVSSTITSTSTADSSTNCDNSSEAILDPCCPDSTESIPVQKSTPVINNNSFSGTILTFPEPSPMEVRLGVLTVSDRASSQIYNDESGPMIQQCFQEYSSKHDQIKLNVLNEKVKAIFIMVSLLLFFFGLNILLFFCLFEN